jgi:glycerol uptake facilitator-like aquaporin
MWKILRNNGLSIVLILLFLLFLAGQAVAGMYEYNDEQLEHGQPTVDFAGYLNTSHFVEATTENWESEFFQMFFFVVLTACLYQKGSAESKDPDKKEPVDRDPRKSRKKKNAPWPVRKGGLTLTLYEYSLSLAFLLLFLMSFTLHAVSGAREYNESEREHGHYAQLTTVEYMGTPRFWFESFQNWQSEFLAVGAMVVLSIFLRQRGSPESKPVDSPHSETGE